MFLSKELFEDVDSPVGAAAPLPLRSLPTPGAASSSSSPALGARPGTGGATGGGGGGALRPGESLGPEDDDQAAPTGAAALRQKMLQQRQRTLQKRHSATNIAANPMVMANEALPAEVPTPSGGSRPSPLAQSSLSRPGTAASLGIGIPEAALELSRAPGLRSSSSASSLPLSPALSSPGGRLSFDERSDPLGMVMPEPSPDNEREEEARRRSNLAQELDERGICPVYDPTPDGMPRSLGGKEVSFDIDALSASELKPFLLNPSPKHAGMIECRIIRERTGLNKLFPKYTLESDAGTFLLSAKKQTQNKTSNYAISMSKSDGDVRKDGDQFLGKLRSNFLGLEFTAYGTGLNPKKIDPSMAQAHAIQMARQELIGVQYSSSLWGAKPRGPRKMSAVMPRVSPTGERLVCRTLNPDSEGLLPMLRAGNTQLIDVYQNKPPKWNEQIGAFVLNFNKRVTMASVKNFQLTTSEDPDTVYLQFGRVGKDEFNMDFRHPFSPFQAFAVCLSSFKLCCE